MWDSEKRRRFEELRGRESLLTSAERAELTSLVHALEEAEAAYLNGTTQTLRKEREITEQQNRSLEKLVNRKKSLLDRLNSVLDEACAERRAIETELASVLGNGDASNTRE